jgi:hypothetical protein
MVKSDASGSDISTDIPWTSWLFFSIENHDISWWCFIPDPTRQELPVHKFEVLHAEEDGCSDVFSTRWFPGICPKPLLSKCFYNFVCFLPCIFFLPGKPWRTPQAFSTKSSGHVRCCFFASFFGPL